MNDGDEPPGLAIEDTHGLSGAGAAVVWPLTLVFDVVAVYERRSHADDGKCLGDEGRQSEILLMPTAFVVADRAGVAGGEEPVVTREQRANVSQKVCSLRQRPFSVVEACPTADSRGVGDLLETQDVGAACAEPAGEFVEHRAAPGVERDDPHRL